MTPSKYVNYDNSTQAILASFLSLFPERHKDDTGKSIINISYTHNNAPDLGSEKILNLTYRLEGKWRLINPVVKLGAEEGKQALEKLLSLKGQDSIVEKNQHLGWLYNNGRDLSAGGSDFETGIKNLFELMTVQEERPLRTEDGQTSVEAVMRPIVIMQSDIGFWYMAFRFDDTQEESKFVQL